MTQFQFEMICKILENGAPVLAVELCTALNTLVQERNAFAQENEQLKKELTTEAANTDIAE